MLDDAAYASLWRILDETGSIRPEYLLPTLQIESGMNPSVPNSQGYDYYGINQISGGYLRARGIAPADYLTWPASRQLDTVVRPFLLGLVKQYGPLRSGTRVYQANLYPASVKTATSLDSVILRAPPRPCMPPHRDAQGKLVLDPNAYCSNKGLDVGAKGTITVQDIATFVGHAAGYPAVKTALARTYALRPGETMRDPVLGEDFTAAGTLVPAASSRLGLMLAGAGVILGVGVGLAYAIHTKKSTRGHAREAAEENPSLRAFEEDAMHVQTLLFPRDTFTVASAKRWARDHDFSASKVDVPEGGKYIRIRQEEPLSGGVKRMITLKHTGGIKAVVQRP